MDEEMKVCSLCGCHAKGPLLDTWRADIEDFTSVCESCADEIVEMNAAYTKAILAGCLFTFAILFIITIIVLLCSL